MWASIFESVARKAWECDSCGNAIPPGTRYSRTNWGKGMRVQREHIHCPPSVAEVLGSIPGGGIPTAALLIGAAGMGLAVTLLMRQRADT